MAKNYGQVEGPNGETINPLLDNPKLQIDPSDLQKINTGAGQVAYGAKVFKTGFLDGTSHKNSIIGMAKKNVFEFPVFVSDTVPLEYATAVNSLLEQVYASYLQMALSTDPVISSESLKQKGGQFSKFKSNTAKYLECVDLSYQKDACHAEYHNEDGSYVEFNLMAITDNDAEVINEYMDGGALSEFDHYFQEADQRPLNLMPGDKKGTRSDPLNLSEDKTAFENIIAYNREMREQEKHRDSTLHANNEEERSKQRHLRETQDRAEQRTAAKQKEADILSAIESNKATPAQWEQLKRMYDTQGAAEKITNLQMSSDKIAAEIEQLDRANAAAARYRREEGADYEYDKMKLDIEERAQKIDHAKRKFKDELTKLRQDIEIDAEKHAHDMKIKAAEFIDENKINKMNTMKPLMMVVNMSYMDKAGGISRPIEYVVGVKTHCRVIDSSILPEVVQYPMKEMNDIARKVKWRAGELKFFKDIVFRIKEKKQTAIDSRDPRRKWFRRLYELAHMKGDGNVSKKIGGSGASHGLIPDVTMVISKADVDNIESVTGIDMLKGSNAKKLCEELFLMNFVVIDQDTQSIKILTPDLHNDFEVQSIGAVERQIAQLSTAGAKTMDIFKNLK